MRHLLLVDDEPEVLDGLQQILAQLKDIVIHTACFASKALELIEQEPVELVIADIRMPGINGIEMWEKIHQQNPECKVIFLSGVRDFDHIYRVIQNPHARFLTKLEPEERILSVVTETLDELVQQDHRNREIQQQALHTYLTCSDAERADAYSQLETNKGPVCMGPDTAFAYFTITHSWAISKQEQYETMSQLAAFCQAQSANRASLFIRMYGNCALWLLQWSHSVQESLFAKEVKSLCEQIAEKGVSLRCVYCLGVNTWNELGERYRESAEWCACAAAPESSVLSYQEVLKNRYLLPQEDMQNTRYKLQTLQSCLSLGQKESFHELTKQLFLTYTQPRLNAISIMNVYYGVLSILYHSLEKHQDDPLRETIRNEHLDLPASRGEWEAVLERLLHFSDKVFETLYPQNPYAHPEVITSIQCYIRDHLDSDLSLDTLSTHFKISPSYLSRLFRENTGEKLHDYITMLRLGSARTLLLTSGLRINEIAQRVGYDSTHTFIRAFRRQFGDTPSEFREKRKKDT